MLVSPGSFNHLTKLDLRRMHNKLALDIKRAAESSLQKGLYLGFYSTHSRSWKLNPHSTVGLMIAK